ncbi:MAG: hypothetical protein AB7G23_19760 [Vicinamibacterales bacterium]
MAPVVNFATWTALPGKFGPALAQFQRIVAASKRYNPTSSAWITLWGGSESYHLSMATVSISLGAAMTEHLAAMSDPEAQAIIAQAAESPVLGGMPSNMLLRPLDGFRPETWPAGGEPRAAIIAAGALHPDVLAGIPVVGDGADRHGLVANFLVAQIGGAAPPHLVSVLTGPADSFGDRFEALSQDKDVRPVMERTQAHRFATYLSQELLV